MKNYTVKQINEFAQENWPEMHTPLHEFSTYLYRVRDLSFTRAREATAGFNLSGGEFDILAALRRSPKPHVITPTELQHSLLITSGGLTKLLYQLAAAGLIKRSIQEQDKRSKLVHLTPKGKKIIGQAMVAAQATNKAWLDEAFTEQEFSQLRLLLSKAANVLEQNDSAEQSD